MFRDPYDPWRRAWPPRSRAVPVAVTKAEHDGSVAAPEPAQPDREEAARDERPATSETPAPPARDDALRHAISRERSERRGEAEGRARDLIEELEGAKRRLERDRERVLEETRAGVVDRMLPVLDNLDRSIDTATTSGDAPRDDALLTGIRLVRDQFEDALRRSGLERIESSGARFDPTVHDAIGVVDVDDPALDGVVVDEWQRGYRLGKRIVRAPKVRVGRLRTAPVSTW